MSQLFHPSNDEHALERRSSDVKRGPGRPRKFKSGTHLQSKSESIRYHCNYCRKDISSVVRLRCAVCTDFDLCVECFSVGVEVQDHKRDHDYMLMDYMAFPIFDPAWGADEELLLLDSVQRCGVGNWPDISEQLDTKAEEECRDHYFKFYIETPNYPTLDLSGCLTKSFDEFVAHKKAKLRLPHPPLSPPTGKKGAQKKPKKATTLMSQPVTSPKAAGFMAKRQEFEHEWINDLDFLLVDMRLSPDDEDQVHQLKLDVVKLYNRKLKERYLSRDLVLHHDLIEEPPSSDPSRAKSTKEEKDLRTQACAYLRLQTREEHEQFVEGIVEEVRLRNRLKKLQEWRQNGIRTAAEGEFYVAEKKKRLAGHSAVKPRDGTYERKTPYPIFTSSDDWISGRKQSKKRKPQNRKSAPLDITATESLETLTGSERTLCSSLRLFPQQYVVIKEALLREYLRRGRLDRSMAKRLVRTDSVKAAKIYDFMEECGWFSM